MVDRSFPSVSSTAFLREEVKCPKCDGEGKLFEETTMRLLRKDGTLAP